MAVTQNARCSRSLEAPDDRGPGLEGVGPRNRYCPGVSEEIHKEGVGQFGVRGVISAGGREAYIFCEVGHTT